MATIKLPSLGENIESGEVLSILVGEGDTVQKDQDLIEIETDKATMPVPSPQAGRIAKILVSEGDTIEVGGAILELETESAEKEAEPEEKEAQTPPKKTAQKTKKSARKDEADGEEQPEATEDEEKEAAAEDAEAERGEEDDEAAQEDGRRKAPSREAEAAPKKEPSRAAAPSRTSQAAAVEVDSEDLPGDGHAAVAAGPSVRRLARHLGVDLRRVRPSGEGGRITADDVESHVRAANEKAASSAPGVTPPGTPDTDKHGAVRVEKLSRMRQTIGRNMTLSYTTIPQLTNFDDVDITELEEMRDQSKRDYEARGIKLTTMPFLVKAAASALRSHPIVNASLDEENNKVVYKEYVNIGIAVDTERGLVVPVLRDADRLSIAQIAKELGRLATMAREGTYAIDDLRGGTFTISNLGAVGGTYSTPIINPPEAAILLAGRSRMMPWYVAGQLQPRLVMPLSLTYDHRLVDGAAAARFLNDVKAFLAAPGRLLLAP